MSDKHRSAEMLEARLQDFLHDCAASAAAEEQDRLREAALLLSDIGRAASAGFDIADYNTKVSCGAGVSAVLLLMGPDLPFMLSRGEAGASLATTVLPGLEEESIAEGATPALALLASYVSSLVLGLEVAHPFVTPAVEGASLRLH